MERLIREIIERIRTGEEPTSELFTHVARKYTREHGRGRETFPKKKVLPYFQKMKAHNTQVYRDWNLDEELEAKLMQVLLLKPRRTSSGVATITVITKPWTCSSDCIYCPSDLRMPKSYLHDEPACQRAERNFFDPYLQITSRLRALQHMGHVTDKIELIVLGGTWTDYSRAYQTWFITELLSALNDEPATRERRAQARRKLYEQAGIARDEAALEAFVHDEQDAITSGAQSYNQGFARLYGQSDAWKSLESWQQATKDELFEQQRRNEEAKRRVVGLVIETRPDTLDVSELTAIRELGCTKVQIGIQSINDEVLRLNKRNTSFERLKESFALLRFFGFKIHAHYMLNLYGSSAKADAREYREFVTSPAFQPDEVKLYPCVLVESAQLAPYFERGDWKPYSEDELIELLSNATSDTPPFIRISRMIRDISAHDVVAGNKKANLRQLVEAKIKEAAGEIVEIRHSEIADEDLDAAELRLDIYDYDTDVSAEKFLSWRNPAGKIAGFLRLSLPKPESLERYGPGLPVKAGEAMIREVHVYGKVAKLDGQAQNAQHIGLGKMLLMKAEEIAAAQGYNTLKVISSIGTREYYAKLGFEQSGLYQSKALKGDTSAHLV